MRIAQELIYSDGSRAEANDERLLGQEPLLLTASTGKVKTYQFTLPGGTVVFLNADSEISFLSKFAGAERQVQFEGEAYFEVKHNAKQPFMVMTSVGCLAGFIALGGEGVFCVLPAAAMGRTAAGEYRLGSDHPTDDGQFDQTCPAEKGTVL